MYKKLLVFATLLTFFVVVLGAYVRLSDAGLGCPDWPGCYGKVTPFHAKDEISAAHAVQPHGPVSLHKAWKEMVHRYFASTLGFIILCIAFLAWRKRELLQQSPTLAFLLVGVVIFQGLLGKWTVTLLLKPAIVTSHLIGGLLLLSLLTWLTLRQFKLFQSTDFVKSGHIRLLAILSLIAVAAQIILGGWVSTNYAALICQDFPSCQGTFLPAMDFESAFHIFRELGMTADGELLSIEALTAIQWMHRVGALITFIIVSSLAISLLLKKESRTLGLVIVIILLTQIALGISNVYLRLPLVLAVAHNAGAALLLVTMVFTNYVLRKSSHRAVSFNAQFCQG